MKIAQSLSKRIKALKVAQSIARKNGVDARNARPADLVLVQKIDNSKDSYRFSLRAEDNKFSIAKGLLDRNGFIATHMALGIVKAPILNGTEYLGAKAIEFFPDPDVFDGVATADLSESEALEHIYTTGKYTLKTNQDNRIDNESCRHLRTVQETQASATTASMAVGAEFKELGAAVGFGGGDDNAVIINFNCKDKSMIEGDATSNNYLVVILDGAIVHGLTTKVYTQR